MYQGHLGHGPIGACLTLEKSFIGYKKATMTIRTIADSILGVCNRAGLRTALCCLSLLGISEGETIDKDTVVSSILANDRYRICAELSTKGDSFWDYQQLFIWKYHGQNSSENDSAELLVTDPRNALTAELTPLSDSILLVGVKYGYVSPPSVQLIIPLWKKTPLIELWDSWLTSDCERTSRILDEVRDSELVIRVFGYSTSYQITGISVNRAESNYRPSVFVVSASKVRVELVDAYTLELFIVWGKNTVESCVKLLLPGQSGRHRISICECSNTPK